jgi:hypothetical protein
VEEDASEGAAEQPRQSFCAEDVAQHARRGGGDALGRVSRGPQDLQTQLGQV